MWTWSLVTGPIVKTLVIAPVVAFAFLLADRDRRWWTQWVPTSVGVGVAFAGLAKFAVDVVWRPFPDKIPLAICLWIAVAVCGLVLGIGKIVRYRWYIKVLAVVAAILVVAGASIQVNRFYGWYPTVAGLFGHMPAQVVSLDDLDPNAALVQAGPGQSLLDVWQPPADLPQHGVLAEMDPEPAASGFKARSGYVWLPPAYLVDPRPVLPVIVVVGGQPGSPRDWIDSGLIVQMMDEYADAHGGLAPIVAMPDQLGGPWENPLCLDTERGRSLTYLSVDVPAWIKENLTVDTDRRAWAFGGLSQGGTCSLIMAVNAPQAYGRFIDLSGELEPTIGTHAETLKKAFHGSQEAFDAVNPMSVMARQSFPDTAGRFVVGDKDKGMIPGLKELYAAAQRAGMDVEYAEVPGAHDMNAWRRAMHDSLPWLGDHTGLTRARSG